jgi:hypothetical protein
MHFAQSRKSRDVCVLSGVSIHSRNRNTALRPDRAWLWLVLCSLVGTSVLVRVLRLSIDSQQCCSLQASLCLLVPPFWGPRPHFGELVDFLLTLVSWLRLSMLPGYDCIVATRLTSGIINT